MSATTESGTPPRSPRWPSGTRNCCSICRSLRALSSSWTRIGTWRSPASNFADAGHDQRNRAQAVFVEEPEADVGNVFQFLADLEFELPLGNLAIGLRRVIDDQRGAPH